MLGSFSWLPLGFDFDLEVFEWRTKVGIGLHDVAVILCRIFSEVPQGFLKGKAFLGSSSCIP